MDLKGKKVVVVGGAGLIGSHTVDQLLSEPVSQIVVYDNFVRGRVENLTNALKDPRVKIFDIGGDIMQTDILEAAFEGADGVFHLAAVWLLQCHDFPRSAFDVNVRGTFCSIPPRPRSMATQSASPWTKSTPLTTKTSTVPPKSPAKPCCAPFITAKASTMSASAT